ncbi:MAG: PIN domain-containing protein [Pirellulaceae bacterium]|nr:PIN domain-containing protein [Pirellulaceae bacterium]
MSIAFADTFYWLALLNMSDPENTRVNAYPVPARLVTSAAVQVEVMDAFRRVPSRATAMRFWEACFTTPELEVVPFSVDLLARSVDLFAARPDKAWSLTDCISFTIMQDRGIRLALTGDHHFVQAGFDIAFL